MTLGANPTVKEFHDHLGRVEDQVRVLGIAIAGLIALGFSDLTSTIAPDARVTIGLFITSVMLTGGLLGRAWIGFQAARRALTRDANCTASLLPDDRSSHEEFKTASKIEQAAVGAIIVSGLLYLLATWRWAV